MLDAIKNPDWESSVETSKNTQISYRYPQTRLSILPTSSLGNHKYSSLEIEFSRQPIPITFMGGATDSVVRFDTWDFTLYRSFEIEFVTYEPNGILFFV